MSKRTGGIQARSGLSKYHKDLEECKKQIEMSIDYLHGSKKVSKRNVMKQVCNSQKLKTENNRSRNMYKQYHTNNTLIKKSQLSSKRSTVAVKSSTKSSIGSRNSKRLSDQRDSQTNKFKICNKENNSKKSNKNPMRYSRNSLGGGMPLQSNLASTGAYNSIAKADDKPSTAVSYGKYTKTKSSRSRPIYQACETGASVEKFTKSSQGNKDTFAHIDCSNTFSDLNEEPTANYAESRTQKPEDVKRIDTRSKPFVYMRQTETVAKQVVNNCESQQSSVWDSAVSEGSLIVQNLPTSKILYATKKDSTKFVSEWHRAHPKRHDYLIKNDSQEESKIHTNLSDTKYEFGREEVYEVESSSDSSDGFDDSMEVEIEIEGQVQNKKMTNLNGCYVTQFKHQPTQPVTVKNR